MNEKQAVPRRPSRVKTPISLRIRFRVGDPEKFRIFICIRIIMDEHMNSMIVPGARVLPSSTCFCFQITDACYILL
ncbi:hypothetical protein ACET3Z_017697 [Daucus carota]